jgi:hypothetical protein
MLSSEAGELVKFPESALFRKLKSRFAADPKRENAEQELRRG